MNRIVFFFLLSIFAVAGKAQQVVSWKYSARKTADKTYELHITATINEGWHVYSQFTPEDGPSFPTKINFNKNPLITFSGKIKEVGALITKHEETLDVNLKYFKNKVDFVQIVKLKSNVKTTITGTVEFMACTDERCLQPKTESFSITIGGAK